MAASVLPLFTGSHHKHDAGTLSEEAYAVRQQTLSAVKSEDPGIRSRSPDPRRRLTDSSRSDQHESASAGNAPVFGEHRKTDTSQRRRDSDGYTVDTNAQPSARHHVMPTRDHGNAQAIALARMSLANAALALPAGTDVTGGSTISDVSRQSNTATGLVPIAPVQHAQPTPWDLPPANTAPPPMLRNPAWSSSVAPGGTYMTPASAWQPYATHHGANAQTQPSPTPLPQQEAALAPCTSHLPVTMVPVASEPPTPVVMAMHGVAAAPAQIYNPGGFGPAAPPQIHPTGVSSVAAVQGSRGSPGSLHSAGALSASAQIIFDRQDEADARTKRIEHALEHFMNRSTDHMQRSEEMMKQMRRDHQASEYRTERLAAKLTSDSVTAAAANASQMELMRQNMINDREQERRSDALSLEARIAPLIQTAIERNSPTFQHR